MEVLNDLLVRLSVGQEGSGTGFSQLVPRTQAACDALALRWEKSARPKNFIKSSENGRISFPVLAPLFFSLLTR